VRRATRRRHITGGPAGAKPADPQAAAMNLSPIGKSLYLFDVNLDEADADTKSRRR
jgi:hypothetical protein